MVRKKGWKVGLFLLWIKNVFWGACSLLLLIFGIINLDNSYELKNPFEFVMTFFSASLMIMIGIVGIVYTVLQIHLFFKKGKAATNGRNL